MSVLDISVLALVLTAVFSAIAVFHARFEDNITQRVGLALLGFACSVRAWGLFDSEMISTSECLVYIGIAVVAFGTKLNKKHFPRKERCLLKSKRIFH